MALITSDCAPSRPATETRQRLSALAAGVDLGHSAAGPAVPPAAVPSGRASTGGHSSSPVVVEVVTGGHIPAVVPSARE